MDNEITVEVNISYEELDKLIKENGFEIVDKYTVDDIYMIDNRIDTSSLSNREILSKCILVRDISPNTKYLTYKYKEYNQNGDIVNQKKISCPIENIAKALEFMEAINYKKLFELNDSLIIYSNDIIELAVQLVDDHIYIELEAKYKDKVYTIEELKNMLDNYNLPYDKSNYFVKKAEIKMEEITEL